MQKCKIQIWHGEYILKTTDKYLNYEKKGYRFCETGLILDNLSEHQIVSLSNLLRGNDCFISQPTGQENPLYIRLADVYISFRFYMKRFSYFRSNDVYVEPKTQEIVISNM
jgi:hypothetical protein